MPSPFEEERKARSQRTLYLLIGGLLSLLIPLLGVAYLKLTEGSSPRLVSGQAIFAQRRDLSPRARITPAQVPAAPAAVRAQAAPAPSSPPAADKAKPRGGDSLSFIRGDRELFEEKPQAQAPQADKAPAPEKEEGKKPKAAQGAKPAKKPFAMPKLKPSSGFTDFKSKGGLGLGAQKNQVQESPQDIPPDMQKMLKDLPAGAQGTPEVQELLKGLPERQEE